MDIKKTDVFSGIGVFTIQMIANGIWYAFQKNKIFLTIIYNICSNYIYFYCNYYWSKKKTKGSRRVFR